MKSFKVKANDIIYFYYAVVYYLCLSLILIFTMPPDKRAISSLLFFMLFLVMFFIFMSKGFFKKSRRKIVKRKHKEKRIRITYNVSVALALFSSLIFLCAIITYIASDDLTGPFTFLLISLISLFVSLSIFLSESENYNQHYKNAASGIVKTGWIGGSFYAYALARHDFMRLADLTYEQTASRFFVIIYAGLTVIAIVSLVITSISLVLTIFEKVSINVNGRAMIIARDSFPLTIPLFMTALVVLLLYLSNAKPIFNTALEISIPLDTTDTFKCNGTTMLLSEEGEHYYFLVKENEYRVFTLKHDGWYSARLNCYKEKPYFRLSDIQSKKEIVTSNFKAIEKNALDDFSAINK